MEIEKWPNLEKFLNDYKDVFQSKLQERLQENDSNASYSLLKSIEMRVDVDGSKFIVKCSLLDYYKWVDKGSKPHKKKGDGSFIPAIRRWILVKPVRPYPTANGKLPTVEQLTFLISRKIRLEGTKGTGFFTDTKKEMNNKEWKAKIKEAMAKDIRAHLKETLQQLSNKNI